MKQAWLATALILLSAQGALGRGEPAPFPKPAALQKDVRFWVRIYTEVDTHGGLVHDARDLGVVYRRLHFPAGASAEVEVRLAQEAESHYRNILLRLAHGPHKGLKAEEAKVLRLWPKGVTRRRLREAAQQVRFQRGQSDRFRAGLQRSGAWLGYIRAVLREMRLPSELAVLPHVESSFNPRARSKAGAAGLWQFTRPTGRRYLRVDEVVDERFDPYKSTVAAARLLQHNYQITGSWPLAITSYNHGPAGVRRAVREIKTRDIARIVRRYQGPGFGFASRNFYVAFLGALEAVQHSGKYFGQVRMDPRDDSETAPVPAYVAAAALEGALGVDSVVLRAHNPALQPAIWSGKKYVPRGFELRLPRHLSGRSLESALAEIAAAERFESQAPDRLYTVRRGDTLSEIARAQRASVADLLRLNALDDRRHIRSGQVLTLPLPKAPMRRAAPNPAVAVAAATQAGTDAPVKSAGSAGAESAADFASETLSGLADYRAEDGIDLEDVAEAFPDATGGAEADSPEGAPAMADDPADYSVARDGTIEVQAGETLGHLAEWLEVPSRRLGAINRIKAGQDLVAGRRLRLDFSRVPRAAFQARRTAYHRTLQEAFFSRYQIAGVEAYRMRPGDSLWVLATRASDVPLWLLRQYNPDLDAAAVRPGTVVTIPRVEHRAGNAPMPRRGRAA
jgi:membrane-bound lytic murein transglycosylase D